jgi:hypothetical protein
MVTGISTEPCSRPSLAPTAISYVRSRPFGDHVIADPAESDLFQSIWSVDPSTFTCSDHQRDPGRLRRPRSPMI